MNDAPKLFKDYNSYYSLVKALKTTNILGQQGWNCSGYCLQESTLVLIYNSILNSVILI